MSMRESVDAVPLTETAAVVEVHKVHEAAWFVFLHGPYGRTTLRSTGLRREAMRDAQEVARALGCAIIETAG